MRCLDLADAVVDNLIVVEFDVGLRAADRRAVVSSGDQQTRSGVEVTDHPNKGLTRSLQADQGSRQVLATRTANSLLARIKLPARQKSAIVPRAMSLRTGRTSCMANRAHFGSSNSDRFCYPRCE